MSLKFKSFLQSLDPDAEIIDSNGERWDAANLLEALDDELGEEVVVFDGKVYYLDSSGFFDPNIINFQVRT